MRKKDELVKGCMSRAGENEMTFVLLSRDKAAAMTIKYWIDIRIGLGLNSPEDSQIQEAFECARTMQIEGSIRKPNPETFNKPKRPFFIRWFA